MKTTSSNLIKILTQAMHTISMTNDKNAIFSITEKLLMDLSHSTTATFFIYNQEQQKLYNIKDEKEIFTTVLEEKSLLGDAFLLKKTACYNYILSEKSYLAKIDNPYSIELKAQILLPIIENDEVIGMIRTSRVLTESEPYTQFEIDVLGALDNFLIKMVHIIQSTEKEINQAISQSINTKDIGLQIKKAETIQKEPLDDNKVMLFLANTVHDIRTPSNALYGFLELIEEHTKDKRIKEFVSHAKESASFINTLTDSILSEGKQIHQTQIESQTKKTTRINCIKFFSSVSNLFSANMYDKKIHYIISLDPSMPKEIQIDSLKLKRILINLIGNAYKFTPTAKSIFFTVSYLKEKEHLNISIRDEGIGIAKEKQEDIFQAFAQVKDTPNNPYGGTGLGLSICAKYVKELKGVLEVESYLGKGSKFYFSIPIEVFNPMPCYPQYIDIEKKISILDNGTHLDDIQNICNYLVNFGLPADKVSISHTFTPTCTHLICFQNKLSYDIYSEVKKQGINLLIVEDEMFSLSKNEIYQNENIISLNSYYGDLLHTNTYSKKKRKVLIVDDNKINIMLLSSILELEYINIETAQDGNMALDKLYSAHRDNQTFDIIFIDQHMPNLLGSEVIERYRAYEKAQNLPPVYTISITGDSRLSVAEHALFDFHLSKPFNKQMVKNSLLLKEH